VISFEPRAELARLCEKQRCRLADGRYSTATPFQKATRPLMFVAACFGSG
jgi:hypothetical protein